MYYKYVVFYYVSFKKDSYYFFKYIRIYLLFKYLGVWDGMILSLRVVKNVWFNGYFNIIEFEIEGLYGILG